jgi:hypothetical protein
MTNFPLISVWYHDLLSLVLITDLLLIIRLTKSTLLFLLSVLSLTFLRYRIVAHPILIPFVWHVEIEKPPNYNDRPLEIKLDNCTAKTCQIYFPHTCRSDSSAPDKPVTSTRDSNRDEDIESVSITLRYLSTMYRQILTHFERTSSIYRQQTVNHFLRHCYDYRTLHLTNAFAPVVVWICKYRYQKPLYFATPLVVELETWKKVRVCRGHWCFKRPTSPPPPLSDLIVSSCLCLCMDVCC